MCKGVIALPQGINTDEDRNRVEESEEREVGDERG
jgi:hypothetical protein